MFAEGCPPLPWDAENKYAREAVELYYEVSITCSYAYHESFTFLKKKISLNHVFASF